MSIDYLLRQKPTIIDDNIIYLRYRFCSDRDYDSDLDIGNPDLDGDYDVDPDMDVDIDIDFLNKVLV